MPVGRSSFIKGLWKKKANARMEERKRKMRGPESVTTLGRGKRKVTFL